MASQKGLGRGLGALLGDLTEEPESTGGLKTLPLHKIEPNPNQPRRDFDDEELEALAESIRQHGIIQPLTVREMPNGYYQIIAGERRWRASRLAGLDEVPVVIMEADDRKAMELALIENLQRQDLNPVEEAQGYDALINRFGMTQEEAAERVGKSRPAVTNALRLLTLSEPVLEKLKNGELTAGHARAILQLKTEKKQLEAAQKILSENSDIVAIMCGNDQMAVGAKTAMNVAEQGQILIYGVDGSPDIKKELKKTENQIAGTVAQSPISMGKDAANTVLNILNGKDYEKEIKENVFMINQENVDMYGVDGWQ